jgi:nicotinamidase/pyrazinamidase
MSNQKKEKPSLLIIDMVKDNFVEERHLPITPLAKKIINPINNLSSFFRKNNWPVIFSTDSFHTEDFIFTSSMHPHSLAGTKGAEIIDELVREETDLWVPKPRFSAFLKTGLETQLQEMNVSLCAVAGISTNFCVLSTVMDAICHDFKAVLLEDCSAANKLEIHEQTLGLYRRNALYPLLRVASSLDLIKEFSS